MHIYAAAYLQVISFAHLPVYLAENEQLVREHARIADFPAVRISEVRAMIDPTMRYAAIAADAAAA